MLSGSLICNMSPMTKKKLWFSRKSMFLARIGRRRILLSTMSADELRKLDEATRKHVSESNRQGVSMMNDGNLQAAQICFEHALRWCPNPLELGENELRRTHWSMRRAIVLNNLGQSYMASGDLDAAEKHVHEMLQCRTGALDYFESKDHNVSSSSSSSSSNLNSDLQEARVGLVNGLRTMATFQSRRGRDDVAAVSLQEALRVLDDVGGRSFRALEGLTLNDLALLDLKRSDAPSAERHLTLACDALGDVVETNRADLSVALNNLASFYERQQRDVDAERAYRRLVEALEPSGDDDAKSVAERHPQFAKALDRYEQLKTKLSEK
jgi:tetratricopeptide (TPR) repeat protein